MDHQEIVEQNIPDLYLMNKLPSEVRLRFEEHFVSCPECLNRLEATESLRSALRKDLVARTSRPIPVVKSRTSLRTYAFATAAAAILIFAGLLATRELLDLRNRLSQASASLEQERNKNAALNDQIAATAQPQATALVFPLVITRGGPDNATPPVNRVVLPETPGWLVLSLDLPDTSTFERHRAVLRDSRGTVLSDLSNLKSSSRDTLAISFLSSRFMPGDYVISLEGLTAGRSMPLGNYSFRVLR
ncbi:MAG TPA: hypothetical protein VE422_26590 [Terriglobia bacterium]|nr:hypothetical protein [Terriglobia bacterium]